MATFGTRMGYIPSVIIIALTVVHTYPSDIKESGWDQDLSQVNTIFTGDVLFSVQAFSSIGCAHACGIYNAMSSSCIVYTYTTTTKECRGYRGELLGQVSQTSTRMWKKGCRLPGYTFEPVFLTCIKLYTIAKTWTDAKDACALDSAYLLVPDTPDKLEATKSGLFKDTFAQSDRWWVGGYDVDSSPVNDFQWIRSGVHIDENSNLWHTGEPNSSGERCVNLYPHSAGLNDLTCSLEDYYACQEDV